MFKSLSTLVAGPVILAGQAMVCVGSVAVSAGSTVQMFGLIKEHNWEKRAAVARAKSSGKQAARLLRNDEKLQACAEAKAIKAERKAQQAADKTTCVVASIKNTVQEMHQTLSEADSAVFGDKNVCPA